MGNLIQSLAQLGFTELESRCLVSLAESGQSTGYELAKKLGASRSNVYAVLQTLSDKGVVLLIKGEPIYYRSVTFEEIQEKIQSKMDASFCFLKKHFPIQLRSLDDFFTLDGEKQVVERVRYELQNGHTEIIADVWTEEAELFGDFLVENEQRGLRVLVSSVGKVTLPLSMVLMDDREESWQSDGWRKFSFVIDRRIAIIGVRGSKYATKALITEHPALVKLLLNNFFHDIVIHEIMKDMKDEMETRYGRNFEEIYRKYTGKGWNDEK
jgi:HTH-type transcriptional regulator, sugar sensing transcriptional regulator